MPQFRLIIDLGNDAMHTGADIAQALRKMADIVDNHNFYPQNHNIFDRNGNVVGHYEVTE